MTRESTKVESAAIKFPEYFTSVQLCVKKLVWVLLTIRLMTVHNHNGSQGRISPSVYIDGWRSLIADSELTDYGILQKTRENNERLCLTTEAVCFFTGGLSVISRHNTCKIHTYHVHCLPPVESIKNRRAWTLGPVRKIVLMAAAVAGGQVKNAFFLNFSSSIKT